MSIGAEKQETFADALGKAWDDDIEGAEDEEELEPESELPVSGEDDEPRAEDDEGNGDEVADDDAPLVADSEEPKEDGAVGDAAPSSLPADAREAWGKTPDAVKEHIAKFEQRMEGLATKYGEGHKRLESMDRALQPFQQFFAINGSEPGRVVSDVLGMAARLQMGSPQQRAQTAAQIIKQFDVDIGALDSMLAGEGMPPEAQQNQQFEAMLNQRLSPLQQQLAQYQQRDQQMAQAQQQEIASELQQFADSHEFYMDVQSDMADILDLAANRGQKMPLDEAYDRACKLHPKVSKILDARMSGAGQQRRRRAASSVSGSPGGSPGAPEAGTTRQALENAWDNYGRI